ncbi:transposase, MuDR, MULE transposase domain protein [Tanacetum coccineum]
MACSVSHTDDEIQALVQKLIYEDMVRQKAILDLALQFDDACTAKDDFRKAYEKCNDIRQESRALIDNFLKEGSDKDYELNLSMYRKAAKIEKQRNAKLLHQLHLDEEALRETLEEEAMDAKEREDKIRQKQVDDEEFMLEFEVKYDSEYDIVFLNFKFQRLLFRYKCPFTIVHFLTQLLIKLSQMDFNLNNENDPWELSLDIDDSDLHLTPVLRPSSSTRVEPSPSTPNPVRIIPGPAGIVQASKLLKQRDILLGLDGAVMSTQEYMKKVVEDVGEDEDFKRGVVVAIVKSCSPNAIGDLTVTMKDLSGTIPGTIHYKVIGDGGYGKDITVGAALILANVLVFSPKPSMHYLNITMRNVVKVFRKDTVPGSGSG